MKVIRKSIFRKAIFAITITAMLIAGSIFAIDYLYGIENIPFFIILFGSNILLIAVFIYFFTHHVHFPLKKLHKEIDALLSGKPYRRIVPGSIDEFGVLTHFFNEITQNLETISFDIKKTKRISSELDVAAKIQKDVLPKEAPLVPGLEIVAKTRSAVEVGGDSFDFIQNEENTFIYIGDVTGHGVPSGLVMMIVNTLMEVFAQEKRSSSDVVIETNKFLTPKIASDLFMTSVLLRWDAKQQKMYFTGAGHEHILVYRAKIKEIESIKSGGIALGMIDSITNITHESHLPLEIDDVVVLYTDGIPEAKNHDNEMYGLERLKSSFKRHAYRPSSEEIFDKITSDFADFVGEYVQKDDITLIVLKYKGKDAPQHKVKLMLNVAEDKLTMGKRWNWE